MSVEAFAACLGYRVGDATLKLILLGRANHAHADGRNSWARPKVIAQYAECSVRTVQRRTGELLAAGWLREGDQSIVAHLRGDSRPIVYDVAMSLEQAAAWAAAYRPDAGRRAVFAAAGARGGKASAAAKRAAEVEGGDNLAPREDNEEPQVNRGDNLAPRMRGDNLAPRGVPAGVTPRGDTAVSPKPSVEPSQEPPPSLPSATTGGLRLAPSGGEGDFPPEPGMTIGMQMWVRAVRERQPGWRPAAIASALEDAVAARSGPGMSAAAERRLHQVATNALLAIAAGEYGPTVSPRRLVEDGPWWTAPPLRAVTAATGPRCGKHPDQPADPCGSCRGEELAAKATADGASTTERAEQPRPAGAGPNGAFRAARAALRPSTESRVRLARERAASEPRDDTAGPDAVPPPPLDHPPAVPPGDALPPAAAAGS